jgi:hypothetical protein
MSVACIENHQIRPWIAFTAWSYLESINLPRPSPVDARQGTLTASATILPHDAPEARHRFQGYFKPNRTACEAGQRASP